MHTFSFLLLACRVREERYSGDVRLSSHTEGG